MSVTFAPDAPLRPDRNAGEEAVEKLQQSEKSATGRIFAAASWLDSSPLDIEAVIVSYAREVGVDDPMLSATLVSELERLCTAAREQGHDVEFSRVRERATPSTRAQALAAARRLRQSPTLTPQERTDRLWSFVCQARRSGIEISMDDFDGVPGTDGNRGETADDTAHALVPRGDSERPEPPVATSPPRSIDTEPTVAPEQPSNTAEPDSEGQADTQPTADAAPPSEDESSTDTADCTISKVCTTPGWDETPRTYSRQYEQPGTVAVDGGETPFSDSAAESAQETASATAETASQSETDAASADPTSADIESAGATDEDDTETPSESDTADDSEAANDEDAVAESGFVWPADDSADTIDPDESPTVRVASDSAGDTDDQEATAALVRDSETTDPESAD